MAYMPDVGCGMWNSGAVDGVDSAFAVYEGGVSSCVTM